MPRRGDDVVERQVARQVQALQRRPGDAARLAHRQAGIGKQLAQFVGRDEIVPVMRAASGLRRAPRPRRPAAAAIAGVRLGVESTISPPGARCCASAATNAGLSATCSSTSRQVTRSNCAEPERGQLAVAVVDRRGPSPRAWCRAASMFSAAASTPVTSAPSRASGSHSSPAPQPTSSARLPASGLRALESPPQCRSIASRRKPSRTGFSRCSIAELPFGSHQSLASAPKCAASSGRMVAVATVASGMRRP